MLDPVELFPEVSNLYEFPSVHADMVFDQRRVNAYQQAIKSKVKPGDIVVDIGAGTGLLSFLALQAGASRVYAIERSPVIKWAKLLAEKNGFSDKIIFHNSDSRDIELPEKADVIVSELIGHLAFEEGMAETIPDARERFLKPQGALIPSFVSLHAALVCEREIYPKYIDSWGSTCGIDYSVMREQAVQSAFITDISERDLLSKSEEIFSVDFTQSGLGTVDVTPTYRVLRHGIVNGIALWFDANLAPNTRLSSGPWTKTHWKQCFIPFAEPTKVSANENFEINIKLNFRETTHDKFSVDVTLMRDR